MEYLDCIYSDDIGSSIVDGIVMNLKQIGREYLLCDGPVVDLGCGNGTVLYEFKKGYPHIKAIGLDRNPRKLYENIDYRTENIIDTKLPVNSAKIVLMVNLSDYLGATFTQTELFTEVDRILAPGGLFIPADLFRKKLVEPFQRAGYTSLAMDYQEKPFKSH